ncbi:MAG: SDR family NAD(P)-dependent oxidoreductase, partial [Cocleimonas sp.]|nr:SDR family NAD(P)-dependent oxidoreductase [Cocleimonas sp.]
MKNLNNKIALVTGSARRIGAVIIRILHEAGANVVVHYRQSSMDAEILCKLLNKIRQNSCIAIQADLDDIKNMPEMIDTIVKKMGKLDIIINNASSFYPTPLG